MLWSIGAVFGTVSVAQAQSKPPDAVGVAVSAYFEDGSVDDTFRTSVIDQSDPFDYENDSSWSLGLSYLTHATASVRYGGELRYLGNYSVTREGVEGDQDPDFTFGPLLEAVARAEWLVPIVKKRWTLLVGGQAGLAMLIPGRDLERQIEELQDEGVGVWSGPRFGYVIGAQVGVRHPVWDRLSLRLDYGIQGSRILVYNTDDEVNGIPVERDTTLRILRHQVALGAEVSF
ncbi:MAG: hypothetical protein AAFS10_16755 [Myxococcota bacterium]